MAVRKKLTHAEAFKSIRIQILYPCNAQCSWCATRLKNPLFAELYQSGTSDQVHDFYVEVIRQLQPESVFVSGGEPLLYPRIADFLNDIVDYTEQINLFTSYQFSRKLRQQIPFIEMPLEKIMLCHTMIAFEPKQWAEMTGNFPFDLYVENIKKITSIRPGDQGFEEKRALRKRFKFIINHEALEQEIALFQDLIDPDESFEIGFKVINDQGGGINKAAIQQTRSFTHDRVLALDGLIDGAQWGSRSYKVGSVEKMAPLLENGNLDLCPYRTEPLELRFAFYRSREEGQVLKYRYCPYFPSDFGYRFHIGRDDPGKFVKNFEKGSFHEHCHDCRFLKYLPEGITMRPDSIGLEGIEVVN